MVDATYRQPRSPARVAEKSNLAGTLALRPSQWFQLQLFATEFNQVIDSLEGGLRSMVGKVHEENLVIGNADSCGGLEGSLQHRHTGEEGLGPGGPELVLQLAG
jgi:hypothetical protein